MNRGFKIALPGLVVPLSFQSNAFAESATNDFAQMMYLIELLAIAAVAIALIFLTISITRSQKARQQTLDAFREEANQEKAILKMTLDAIHEKESRLQEMINILRKDKSADFSPDEHLVFEEYYESVELNEDTQDDEDSDDKYIGPETYLLNVRDYYGDQLQKTTVSVKYVRDVLDKINNHLQGDIEKTRSEQDTVDNFISILSEHNHDVDGTEKSLDSHNKLLRSLHEARHELSRLKKYQQDVEHHYSDFSSQLNAFEIPDFTDVDTKDKQNRRQHSNDEVEELLEVH